jgi:hypothetical protein
MLMWWSERLWRNRKTNIRRGESHKWLHDDEALFRVAPIDAHDLSMTSTDVYRYAYVVLSEDSGRQWCVCTLDQFGVGR